MKKPSFDRRLRGKNGRIGRKHGNMRISTLRKTYGANFAPTEDGNTKLRDVLHRLDKPSLAHLVHDLIRN